MYCNIIIIIIYFCLNHSKSDSYSIHYLWCLLIYTLCETYVFPQM